MSLLSESDSKAFLARHGVVFPDERLVRTPGEAGAAATELGYPVVVKLGGTGIAHKTERGLVRLGLESAGAVENAASDLLAAARPEDGPVHLLVAPMIRGSREFIAGLHRDPTFGMVVMLGVGGVLAEAVDAASCRLVPIDDADAAEMIDEFTVPALLGAVRSEPPVDRRALGSILVALSRAAEAEGDLLSADLNPLIVAGGRPVPVDALVEWRDGGEGGSDGHA